MREGRPRSDWEPHPWVRSRAGLEGTVFPRHHRGRLDKPFVKGWIKMAAGGPGQGFGSGDPGSGRVRNGKKKELGVREAQEGPHTTVLLSSPSVVRKSRLG